MLHNNKKNKRLYTRYFLWYSGVFVVLATTMYIMFKACGKSFLWDVDGTRQHYPALYYIGDYLKNIVKGLLGQTDTTVGMMDFKLGQGLDVLTTLNYYGFGDPLTLTALFVKQEHIEGLYTCLIFIRLYFTGAAFSYYCFSIRRKEQEAVLLGAIVYTFCGMALFSSVRHPFFINAMIYLLLLLAASERMIQKKKYGFFSCMVALSLVTNFYFAYMNTAIVGIYLLFRIFGMEKGTVKEKCSTIGKMCLSYLLGTAISAVVFIPVVYAFLQNTRSQDVGGYTASLLYYDWNYYSSFISNYISPKLWINWWMIGGMASICLISVAYLFFVNKRTKEKKETVLKGSFLVLLIFVLVPVFGKIFNGFGYVCNRWNYAFVMVNAMIVVFMVPRLITLNKKERSRLAIIMAVYAVVMIAASKFTSVYAYIGAACLLIMVGLIYICGKKKEVYSTGKRYGIVIGFTVVTIMVYMASAYLPLFGNYVGEFIDSGSAYSYNADSPVSAVSEIEDDSFYRVEQPWLMSNQAAVLGYYGNTFYWSVIPSTITEYYDGIGLASLDRTYECNSQDARTVLNELSSTKYYVTESDSTGLVPYGYEYLKSVTRENGTVDNIYQNRYALSIGYALDGFIRKSEYEKIASVYKQEVLMTLAVIPDESVTEQILSSMKEVKAEEFVFTTHEIDCEITALDGIEMDGSELKVTKAGASMEISFAGQESSETYLYVTNFKVNSGKDYNRLNVTSDGGVSTSMFLYRERNAAHYEKTCHGVNLGSGSYCKVTITFPSTGTFSFDTIKMYSYPLSGYDKEASALMDEQLSNVSVNGNKVSGDIVVSDTKWLQFSIPYSKGWTAYVDGVETALSASDTAYMGLLIEEGKHTIVLKYKTPYITIGALITLLAVIGLAVWTFIAKRKDTNDNGK